MKKGISIGIGVALLAGGILLAKNMIEGKKKPEKKFQKTVTIAFTRKVANDSIPIIIRSNGSLVAFEKMLLYSEVQGVLQFAKKRFRTGEVFKKGEVLVKMDSREHYANLMSEKSNLYSLITAMLPDLKLDYPDAFPKWESFLNGFDLYSPLPVFPEISTQNERYFVIGRGIVSKYFQVKNLETRLSKYRILAPFDGVLSEANITEGTLVRTGQKLGEFIKPGNYEMQVSINASFETFLRKGKEVDIRSVDGNKTWAGRVSRINKKLDENSQTVSLFIAIKAEDLREGMYLEALIHTRNEANAIKISRSLLVNEKKIFTVVDSTLVLKEIEPVYFFNNTVVIKGLENGSLILKKPIPGAHQGMPVEVYSGNGLKEE